MCCICGLYSVCKLPLLKVFLDVFFVAVFFCVHPWVRLSHVCFLCFQLQCFTMDAASDSQCGDNRGEDRGTGNSNDKMKFKIRRKALRLNSPAPQNRGSEVSDGHDSDYVPPSP